MLSIGLEEMLHGNYKKEVNKKLSNDNAKFTGFLMMGMEALKPE